MPDKQEAARQYLTAMIDGICLMHEQLVIESKVDENGITLLVSASTKDLPIIIGKRGSVANSIRKIMQMWGKRHNAKVNVTIP